MLVKISLDNQFGTTLQNCVFHPKKRRIYISKSKYKFFACGEIGHWYNDIECKLNKKESLKPGVEHTKPGSLLWDGVVADITDPNHIIESRAQVTIVGTLSAANSALRWKFYSSPRRRSTPIQMARVTWWPTRNCNMLMGAENSRRQQQSFRDFIRH